VEELERRYGPLTPLGEGTWSTAYLARSSGRDRVVRIGRHLTDFLADQEAARFSSAALPVPQVLEIDELGGSANQMFVCVTTFAPGQPLEHVTADEWSGLVPAVADVLDALRSVRPFAPVEPWADVLLATDELDTRLPSWRERLARWPDLHAAYTGSTQRLRELCEHPAVTSVAPSLVHGDLLNRNVHVADGRITGVFDWGSRRWGDHLYDLALMVFWAPWHPNLDVGLLVDEMTRRWGGRPDLVRLNACLTEIGASHIAFNAAVGRHASGVSVCRRLVELNLD
jgi:hygromycin-B 4-O-kinase